METVGERIAKARKTKGVTQTQLAEACGWGQSRVGNYETGFSNPNADDFRRIAAVLGVSPAWLQFGEHVGEAAAPYAIDTKYAQVRRYEIAAGAGGTRENGHEEISGTHAYRRDWLDKRGLAAAACVVIEVDGESMAPTIADGDVVLVNTADRKLANGHVFAFRHEDGPRIKRLFKQLDGRVRVVSDNPDKISYPDEWLTPGTDTEIIGRVVHRSGGI